MRQSQVMSETGRELNSAVTIKESSSIPGNKPDRADVPVVDVNIVEHNASVIRRDTLDWSVVQ